jgi:tetratricopeptide (TPR) repeat protein
MNATPRPHYEEIDWLDYVQGEIGIEAKRSLDAHLSGCGPCRDTVASMGRLSRALPAALRLVDGTESPDALSADAIVEGARSGAADRLAGSEERREVLLAAFSAPDSPRDDPAWDSDLLEEAGALCRELLRNDPPLAGRILRRALSFLEGRENEPAAVSLRASLAYVLLVEGAVEESLAHLDAVRAAIDELPVPEIELGFWHYVRSRALYSSSRPAEALVEIRAARVLYERLEDRDRIFRCRQAEAVLVSDLGKPEEAVRLYRRILDDTRLGDDRTLHANLLMNYAADLVRSGELAEGRRVYIRASALLQSTGQQSMLFRVRVGLAGVAEGENRLEEALAMRIDLRADFRALSIPWEEIQHELNIAELLLKLDRGGEAGEICRALLPKIEALGFEREAARAVAFLAEAEKTVDLGEIGRVREFLRRLESGEDVRWTAA